LVLLVLAYTLVHDVWDDTIETLVMMLDGWDAWLWNLVHGRGISWVIWHLFEAHGWHVGRGIWLVHIISIWLIHSIDDILWYIVWYWCTWLMYMGVVHGWHTIWHEIYLVDVLFTIFYSFLTYLFSSWCMIWHEFDVWTGPSIVIGRQDHSWAVDLCSSWVVAFPAKAYCSGSILFML
jgi:hypothetical protein